ncbi:hypothetical protein [Zoogloea sp.]|uniref:hypothetical protein n=1 Tax=Zoogloea sp. TaxID=49181 RepID=UPI0035AF73C1
MNTRVVSRVLAPVVLALVSGVAGAACVPVLGSVRLLPDASCQINALGSQVPAYQNQCFSVALNLVGFPAATGFAGVTAEPLVGLSGPTATPAAVIDAATSLPRQSIQTARSVVYIGTGKHRTALYSNDVIVAQVKLAADGSMSTGAVTEQILISGSDGKGAYAKVTGHLNVLGNSIGTSASVTGKLCLP